MARKGRWWCRRLGRWCSADGGPGASDVAEQLAAFRERQGDGSWKHDYLLSNASGHAGGRVRPGVLAQHRVEECLQRAERGSRAGGLRGSGSWRGWYHHQVLGAGGAVVPDGGSGPGEKVDAGMLTVPQLQGLIAGVLGDGWGRGVRGISVAREAEPLTPG